MIPRLLFPKNFTCVCPGTARASCDATLSCICAHECTTGGLSELSGTLQTVACGSSLDWWAHIETRRDLCLMSELVHDSQTMDIALPSHVSWIFQHVKLKPSIDVVVTRTWVVAGAIISRTAFVKLFEVFPQ